MKTWADLERESLMDPTIHAALTVHRSSLGKYPREQMLIDLVFALAAQRDEYKKRLLAELCEQPARRQSSW